MDTLLALKEESPPSEKAIIQDIVDKSMMPNGPQLIMEDMNEVMAAEIAAGRWVPVQ